MAPPLTFSRRRFLLGSAALALGPRLPALAQGTPMPASTASMTVAMRLDRLPAKRVDAFLARYELDPEGYVAAFTRVGTALLVPERGAIALTSDVPLMVRPSGSLSATPTAQPATGDVVLHPGDGAIVAHGARMSLRNHSGEPASVLALLVYGPYREFSYTHPTELPGMTGVTRQVIGFGAGPFEEAPAILVIQRDVIRAGGSAYSSTFRGIEIGAIESGSARATFQSGAGWTTPGALVQEGVPKVPGSMPAELAMPVELDTKDGYTCVDGAINWRATGTGPLIVLRGQVVPVPQPSR